jgi:hypothetical protein
MDTTASITYQILAWDEIIYDEFDGGRKLTRATVKKRFAGGDFEGESALEYLMAYADDGSASFVGMERLEGCLGDRVGSFVLQHVGIFEGDIAQASVRVVEGSATGELEGMQGEGSFELGHAQEFTFNIDYGFE